MKQLLSILCLSLLVISCQKEDQGYYLTGTIPNVSDGTEVYLTELDENSQPKHLDTTQVTEGSFEFDPANVERPNVNFISVEGLQGNVVFISENEKIDFLIHKDSLRSSVVTGGIENQLFYQYIDHLKESNKRLMQSRMAMQEAFQQQDSVKFQTLSKAQEEINENDKIFKRKIVEENPDHLVSAIALSDMMNMQLYPVSEIKEMYNQLSEEIKNTTLGKNLGSSLEKMSAVEIGSKAPNFSAPNPEGEEVSLEDAMGKVTIIDFWASWCKPCRVENPNVVRIYNKYHDQGLNIIGVSLDRPGQKERWTQAIEEDNLTWHHVSNLQFWKEPIAQQYGVRSIPATFILDENGTIVAKDLRGDELEQKIEELLGE